MLCLSLNQVGVVMSIKSGNAHTLKPAAHGAHDRIHRAALTTVYTALRT